MALTNDVIAAWSFALVGPAVLFVVALFLRQVPPPGKEPARTSDRIVKWYAAHPQFALWVLMLLLPLTAFVLGLATLLRTWGDNPKLQFWTMRAFQETTKHWPAMTVGAATLVSMALLVMITAHLIGSRTDRRLA